MRRITFTYYRNRFDKSGQPYTEEWSKWVETLSKHDVRGKTSDTNDKAALDKAKDGRALVLGEIPRGRSHRNVEVVGVHALGIDIENVSDDALKKALEALDPFEYLAYTTHKHGAQCCDGGTRLRIIVPLAEILDPREYSTVWEQLNALIGGINDPQTKNVARLHYMPSTFDERLATAHHHPGKWLAVSDLPTVQHHCAATTITGDVEHGRSLLRKKLRNPPKEDPITAAGVNLKTVTKAILDGKPYAKETKRHETNRDLGMWLAWQTHEDPIPPDAFEPVFAASVAAMVEEADDCPGIDDAIAAYETALEKVAELLQARRDRNAQRQHQKQAKMLTGESPLSGEEIKGIADTMNCSLKELVRRWLCQFGDSYYIWDILKAGYTGPYVASEVRPVATAILPRAPVALWEGSKSGVRRVPTQELAERHGTVVRRVVADATAQRERERAI